jgi:hypothetical protein
LNSGPSGARQELYHLSHDPDFFLLNFPNLRHEHKETFEVKKYMATQITTISIHSILNDPLISHMTLSKFCKFGISVSLPVKWNKNGIKFTVVLKEVKEKKKSKLPGKFLVYNNAE